MLPASLKKWLEKKKWYINWRYAPAVVNAWLFLRPVVKKQLAEQAEMYRSVLSDLSSTTKLVFDIGANEGFVSQLFLAAGYRVVAVEPAVRNIAILRRRFSQNSSVIIVDTAVAQQAGQMPFYEATDDYALGTASDKKRTIDGQSPGGPSYRTPVMVLTTTLDELIAQHGLPVFIKLDVEGLEERVLRGLSKKVPLVAFEAMLPSFTNETIQCIRLLQHLDESYRFNFAAANKLQWETFRTEDELIRAIGDLAPQTIEIFCKERT